MNHVANLWADHKASLASLEIKAGHAEAAGKLLSDAFHASPNNPAGLRTAAAYYEKWEPHGTARVDVLRKLIALKESKPGDSLSLAKALLDQGSLEEARRIFSSLNDDEKGAPLGMEIQAAFLEQNGDKQAADALRRKAFQADMGNLQSRFKLARLDLDDPLEEHRAAARNALWEIAKEKDPTGLDAIIVLASSRDLTPEDSARLLDLVDSRPDIPSRYAYFALSAFIRTHPDEANRVIRDAAAQATSLNIDDLLELARMLERESRFDVLAEVVSGQKAATSPNLFLLRAKALSELRRSTELEQMLTNFKSAPLPKSHLILLNAYLQSSQGNAARGIALAKESLSLAIVGNDEALLSRISDLAQKNEWPDVAEQASIWLASRDTANREKNLLRVYDIASKKRDSSLMLQTARQLARVEHTSTENALRLSYLSLILGADMETASAPRVNPNASSAPLNSPLVTIRALISALASYRFGDSEGMRRQLRSVSDWSALSAGHRAIASALLKIAGDEQTSFRLAEKVPEALLLDEEKRIWLLAYGTDSGEPNSLAPVK